MPRNTWGSYRLVCARPCKPRSTTAGFGRSIPAPALSRREIRSLDRHSDHAHSFRMADVIATARLRGRNQLTLPDPIVQAGRLEEGATFVVELDPGDPDVVRLRRVRSSYAGALK